MNRTTIKRALISVYDKTGIVDFARALASEFGVEIISTGGTASFLKKEGIPVTLVEEVTGFPELMDGRVKTLHPKIHAGILADRDNPEHMRQLAEHGIKPIDMVVVNLYPFEKTVADPNCTFAQAIEMIDIGGPCMLRAAAKNHKHVLPVYDPTAYTEVLRVLRSEWQPDNISLRYASGAFEVTYCYDADVTKWLGMNPVLKGSSWSEKIAGRNWGALRYGENPHQSAELWQNLDDSSCGLPLSDGAEDAKVAMSFNNYLDASAAFELCRDLTLSIDKKQAVYIKHTNACGVGISDDPIEAYRRAYVADPNAAMGGILVVSFPVDANFAEAVMDSLARWGKSAGAGAFFVEVWLAPEFDKKAIEVIRTRKPWGANVRLLSVDAYEPDDPAARDFRRIPGGFLVQSKDTAALNEDQWKVVTKRQPTDEEMADLRLAWLIAKHTKSNAISVVKDGMLIGNGAGQMSRVMSCRIATWLAKENGHANQLVGSVAASDAFFPFPDGPQILLDAGATALIQPGGSKRDEETVKLCDERGATMIFTGTRHFRH